MAVEIIWNKTDPKALKNSTPYMPYFKPFAPADNLTREGNKSLNIGTICELNQTVLNKKQVHLSDTPNKEEFGLWSDNMSDELGIFSDDTKPILRIMFLKPISTVGLTLLFDEINNDYCNDITVEWYKETNLSSLITSKQFFPNNSKYFCDNLVENYKMLYIKFNKTVAPKRFLKLTNIFYGELINFTKDELISCKLTEEVSITSEQISINTLNFAVHSKIRDFDFIKNPKSFSLIEANQTITINKDDVNYGTFYLKKANSNGHKNLEISAVDLMGKLESIPYNGGYFENKTVEFILTTFLKENNLGDYNDFFDIVSGVRLYSLTGYISKTNGRGLLHKLCFASWGILDCSRSDKIKITERKKLAVGFSVDDDTLLIGSFKPEYHPKYDGVVISGKSYSPLDDRQIIETINLNEGIHTRYYSEPYHDIQVGGAKVIKVGSNFATIESKGLNYGIVISGIKYSVSTTEFKAGNEKGENIKTLENIELLSESNGQHIANNLYDI